ncbi:hypothetical protein [Micromonospora craniellae]|uniref:hypothetical protein n=1 Tax=Micromonospora craniellae TaxID=2294034 RepID=UPI0011C1BDA4|nr:hypothetical protein [Micromonospora craniellae]QOC94206.1 hypothetical protein ID554_11745 [Micromonospora craniellae]
MTILRTRSGPALAAVTAVAAVVAATATALLAGPATTVPLTYQVAGPRWCGPAPPADPAARMARAHWRDGRDRAGVATAGVGDRAGRRGDQPR